MAAESEYDLAIVGGGLAGGLIALALAEWRPEIRVVLVEQGERLGGNHIWSFFDSDVAESDRWLVAPLVSQSWEGHDVAFPGHLRRLPGRYHSIRSERLDQAIRTALPDEAIRCGVEVRALGPTQISLASGKAIRAAAVIDARGPGGLPGIDLGWQKFLGRELRLTTPHGLDRPVIMDATVPQLDGYRFVYLLPFAPDRLFVEDTYYSDTPMIDQAMLGARIDDYVAQRGWAVAEVLREEAGALPVVLRGDFESLWPAGDGTPRAGVRAGLFHPTTGYSLPDAIRTAQLIASLPDLGAPTLHDALRAHAAQAWGERGFYRLLDRMLFRAAAPDQRWRVLARFYRLDEGLIGRFYAARSTLLDKVRLLAGKPPVPIGAALKALRS